MEKFINGQSVENKRLSAKAWIGCLYEPHHEQSLGDIRKEKMERVLWLQDAEELCEMLFSGHDMAMAVMIL